MPRLTPATAAKQLATLERRREVMALRIKGTSIGDIALALGLSKSTVHGHVKRALEDAVKADKDSTNRFRQLNLQRFEALLVALWPHATGGQVVTRKRTHKDGSVTETTINTLDTKAAREVRQVLIAMNRLLGLEAPLKIAHTDPTGDEERSPADWAMPVPTEMDPHEWAAQTHKMLADRAATADRLVEELLGSASKTALDSDE